MKVSCLLFFSLFFLFSFSQSGKLIFEYDESGNQKVRKYEKEVKNMYTGLATQSFTELTPQNETFIYPNPVTTKLTIRWNSEISGLITKIEMVSYNGTYVENVRFTASEGKSLLDMTYRLPGVYYVKIYLSDGRVISHSIIKN